MSGGGSGKASPGGASPRGASPGGASPGGAPGATAPEPAGAPPPSPPGQRLIDIADRVDAEDIPLFLARETYRRRRIMDAARLLPVVGLGLVLFPLLWIGQGEGPQTRAGVVYLFGVWVMLIGVAGLIARLLSGPLPPGVRDERDDVV